MRLLGVLSSFSLAFQHPGGRGWSRGIQTQFLWLHWINGAGLLNWPDITSLRRTATLNFFQRGPKMFHSSEAILAQIFKNLKYIKIEGKILWGITISPSSSSFTFKQSLSCPLVLFFFISSFYKRLTLRVIWNACDVGDIKPLAKFLKRLVSICRSIVSFLIFYLR